MSWTSDQIALAKKDRYRILFHQWNLPLTKNERVLTPILMIYIGQIYLWHFQIIKIIPQNMIYSTPLFNLLNDKEIKAIKETTEIRNCKIDDFTIAELSEIFPCLELTGIEKQMFSSDPPLQALWVLMKRYLIHHA